MTTVGKIYDILDKSAPFKRADKYDNSGILVGDREDTVSKVLIALDITNDVIEEAKEKGADLIISHHPVFNFRYEEFGNINDKTPIYNLAKYGISAICTHTCLDVAKGGINDIIFDMLKEPFSLKDNPEILEVVGEDYGYGKICVSEKEFTPKETAEMLKKIFGCTIVKYCSGKDKINKIAYCSGGGGSLLTLAYEKGADAYICGDVKHDRWIAAKNLGISLFDCGHYHTEVIMVDYLVKLLSSEFSDTEFLPAEKGTDIVEYEF